MGSFEEILNSKRFYNKNLILREYDSISLFLCDFLDYVYDRVNERKYFNDLELSNIKRYVDKFISFSETLFFKMKLIYDRSLELCRCCGRKDSSTLKFLIRYFGDIIKLNNCNNWLCEKKELEHFVDLLVFSKNDNRIFEIILSSQSIHKFKYSDGELFINKVLRYFKTAISDGNFEKSSYYSRVIFELLKKDSKKVDFVVSNLREFNKQIAGRNNVVLSLIDRLTLVGKNSISVDEKKNYLKRFKNNYGFYDFSPYIEHANSLIHSRLSQVVDLRNRNIITIDHSFKCAYDDAISIEKTDYGYLFSIYITDVASFVDTKSLLYQYAKQRGESIYGDLNNSFYIPMFPMDVTHDLFSLSCNSDKYVVAYDFKFSHDLEFIGSSFSNAIIRVNNNYTFNSIDKINMDDSNYDMLCSLIKITDKLKENFNSNYHLIKEKNDKHSSDNSVGSGIISTSTIFLNFTIANYFSMLELPFIYRIHGSSGNDIVGESQYSTVPLGHPVVNNKPYAQVTNPIRSYVSFLNQYFFEYFMLDMRSIDERRKFINYWNAELPSLVSNINNNLEHNKEFLGVISELNNKRLTKK